MLQVYSFYEMGPPFTQWFSNNEDSLNQDTIKLNIYANKESNISILKNDRIDRKRQNVTSQLKSMCSLECQNAFH